MVVFLINKRLHLWKWLNCFSWRPSDRWKCKIQQNREFDWHFWTFLLTRQRERVRYHVFGIVEFISKLENDCSIYFVFSFDSMVSRLSFWVTADNMSLKNNQTATVTVLNSFKISIYLSLCSVAGFSMTFGLITYWSYVPTELRSYWSNVLLIRYFCYLVWA